MMMKKSYSTKNLKKNLLKKQMRKREMREQEEEEAALLVQALQEEAQEVRRTENHKQHLGSPEGQLVLESVTTTVGRRLDLDAALRFGSQPFTKTEYQLAKDYQKLISGRVGYVTASCERAGG